MICLVACKCSGAELHGITGKSVYLDPVSSQNKMIVNVVSFDHLVVKLLMSINESHRRRVGTTPVQTSITARFKKEKLNARHPEKA